MRTSADGDRHDYPFSLTDESQHESVYEYAFDTIDRADAAWTDAPDDYGGVGETG